MTWRVRGASATGQFKLRVLRKTGTAFTGAGTSLAETVPPGIESVFATRLPIKQGDYIGLDIPGAPGNPSVQRRLPLSGASFSSWGPTFLGDGESPPREPTSTQPDDSIIYNADIEPDCDSDEFGDETQDPSISSCHPRNVILDASKNKVKEGKRVRLSGRVAETRQGACATNQPVELQRKKPSQATFTTVEQLQTDAAGNFATEKKVKKTFQYRAQVSETATCGGGLSNTEKVKVKKKP